MNNVVIKQHNSASVATVAPAPRIVYSVEFFHIYTDETISERHLRGVEYLRAAEKAWSFEHEQIVLIDNYNPTSHITSAEDVLDYLGQKGVMPSFWAYEGDLIKNAQELLNAITDSRLKRSYARYIDQHRKYPCSLLTASWYLTRLGYFSATGVIHSVSAEYSYTPAVRLVNLLPRDYSGVEGRAHEIILKSDFSGAADKVQDLFYPIDAGRAVDLF